MREEKRVNNSTSHAPVLYTTTIVDNGDYTHNATTRCKLPPSYLSAQSFTLLVWRSTKLVDSSAGRAISTSSVYPAGTNGQPKRA